VRVLYFSDVHIEIRQQTPAASPWTEVEPLAFGPDLTPFRGEADLLILAGDIGRVRSTRNVSPLSYARQAAALLDCPVVLVPGNHEYYRGRFAEDRAALLATADPALRVLDRGEAMIARAGQSVRVLGATLWTDYALIGNPEAAMAAAEREILDHRLIRRGDGPAAFSPADALAEHRLSRAWLARKLAEPYDGPTIIATHHAPHPVASHPGHGLNELAPAFCSDCDDLIGAACAAGVRAWIFGHHHWSLAAERHRVPLLSAQPGYPGEKTGWTGPGRFEL
jgi:predicted MPP superfamily phosphohydrolase